jgi:hypothetical protein
MEGVPGRCPSLTSGCTFGPDSDLADEKTRRQLRGPEKPRVRTGAMHIRRESRLESGILQSSGDALYCGMA